MQRGHPWQTRELPPAPPAGTNTAQPQGLPPLLLFEGDQRVQESPSLQVEGLAGSGAGSEGVGSGFAQA